MNRCVLFDWGGTLMKDLPGTHETVGPYQQSSFERSQGGKVHSTGIGDTVVASYAVSVTSTNNTTLVCDG